MAAQNVSGYSKVLRTLYGKESLPFLLYPQHPLWGMVRKQTDFKGENLRLNTGIAPGGGSSRSFTDAQTNKSGGTYARFLLTRVKDYSLFSIENELLKASRGNEAATVAALKSEGDMAMYNIERSLSIGLWGNGGGARGQIASGSASEVLTLTNPEEIVNFEVGMVIESSATDGTSGSADGEGITITAIDRDAGTLTKAAGTDWNAGGNFAASDYLFREGDFGASISGVPAWIPDTAPSSTAFFSQDRSIDTRLSGTRLTASTSTDGSISNALDRLSSRIQRHGGRPDTAFANPTTYQKLTQELGDKKDYASSLARGEGGEIAKISYEGIKLQTPHGQIKIFSDPDCPIDRFYMLKMDSWCLYSLGGAPEWFDEDGTRMLREASADALEGRIVFYGNLGCHRPFDNGVLNTEALTA